MSEERILIESDTKEFVLTTHKEGMAIEDAIDLIEKVEAAKYARSASVLIGGA